MAEFGVSPSKLRGQISDFVPMQSLLESDIQAIHNIASGLAFSSGSTERIRKNLNGISGKLDASNKKLQSMKKVLEDISAIYGKTEQRIKEQAAIPGFEVFGSTFNVDASVTVETGNGKSSASAEISGSVAEGGFEGDLKYGSVSGEGKILSAEAHASAEKHLIIDENGFDVGASASADFHLSAAEGELNYNSKYAAGSISGSLYTAEASAAVVAALSYQDGRLQGEMKAEASASASAAHGAIGGKLGTDNLDMHGKAEGSLVGAEASASAGIKVNENGSVSVEAKAGAEAYLAKGEVSGGFNIFGIQIDVGAEAMVGVQAEAGGEISTSGFELDLGLGPIGGNLSIDWSQFNPPSFNDVLDWIF